MSGAELLKVNLTAPQLAWDEVKLNYRNQAIGAWTEEPALGMKRSANGVPCWRSRLRVLHYHCCDSGRCCGTGSIPGPGASTCPGCSQKKKRLAKFHYEGRAKGLESYLDMSREEVGPRYTVALALADRESDSAIQSKWQGLTISNPKFILLI